jgi:hypothetical protein
MWTTAIGYKIDEDVAGDDDDDANTPEFLEEEEWSHVDSNHGPPACEADPIAPLTGVDAGSRTRYSCAHD